MHRTILPPPSHLVRTSTCSDYRPLHQCQHPVILLSSSDLECILRNTSQSITCFQVRISCPAPSTRLPASRVNPQCDRPRNCRRGSSSFAGSISAKCASYEAAASRLYRPLAMSFRTGLTLVWRTRLKTGRQ